MKISLRANILIAFALFCLLAAGATRVAHVASHQVSFFDDMEQFKNDLAVIANNFVKELESDGLEEACEFFNDSYDVESVGHWDCYYILTDENGTVVAPYAFAGAPLDFYTFRDFRDGISIGTFIPNQRKCAHLEYKVEGYPYTITGLYDRNYFMGGSSVTEVFYRILLAIIFLVVLILAWIWIIPSIEKIVERQRKAEASLSLARSLQQKAITQVWPSDSRIDCYGVLQPMYEVGGDVYGCTLKDDALSFVIGDVSGKGMQASFMMFMISSLVYSSFSHGFSPAEVMTSMNSLVFDNRDYDMFCTLFIARINLKTLEMEYCNAGHTRAVLDSGFLEEDTNLVLGAIPNYKYTSQKVQLRHGSRLLFYTDGITEARNAAGDFFGEKALLSWASKDGGSATESCKSLLAAVSNFRGKAPQNDDMAIMSIHII